MSISVMGSSGEGAIKKPGWFRKGGDDDAANADAVGRARDAQGGVAEQRAAHATALSGAIDRERGMIPRGVKLRVIGDVHGDARAFAHAIATDRFVLQLGDLVDHGPESAAVLRAMLRLLAEGRGLFLLGNHDLRLARALAGRRLRPDPVLEATLAALDGELGAAALAAIRRAPAWLRQGGRFFVHGGFHTGMLAAPPPGDIPLGAGRITGLLGRALYGEPTGRMQADGTPERSLRWVDRIPPGLTLYCGHDRRSRDGRPYVLAGASGGRAVFLDTGAGKGGHLSWIDLPEEEAPLTPGRP